MANTPPGSFSKAPASIASKKRMLILVVSEICASEIPLFLLASTRSSSVIAWAEMAASNQGRVLRGRPLPTKSVIHPGFCRAGLREAMKMFYHETVEINVEKLWTAGGKQWQTRPWPQFRVSSAGGQGHRPAGLCPAPACGRGGPCSGSRSFPRYRRRRGNRETWRGWRRYGPGYPPRRG